MGDRGGFSSDGNQEKAIAEWHAVKNTILMSLYKAMYNLESYRHKPNPRRMHEFAVNTISVYVQIRPMLKRLKKRDFTHLKELEKHMTTVDINYTNFDKWVGWYMEVQDAVEDLGITQVTHEEEDLENYLMG